ncbi:hypothetical protein JMG10_03440 [Nostoc ellipsosporum NOK]|nr:hypothetical protein [Nostoc ellipsosporum NOK]
MTLAELNNRQLSERTKLENDQKARMQKLVLAQTQERSVKGTSKEIDDKHSQQLAALKKQFVQEGEYQFKKHEQEYEEWRQVRTLIRNGRENSEWIEQGKLSKSGDDEVQEETLEEKKARIKKEINGELESSKDKGRTL